MATLEFHNATSQPRLFELTADETIVGRDQFCDIVLREHTVSRQHARFVRAPDGYYVEDLSSLNGTFVNGRRIEGRTRLQDQDRIHIYEVVTTFHEASPENVRTEAQARRSELAEEASPDEPGQSKAIVQPVHLAQLLEPALDRGSQTRFRAALRISLDLEGGLEVDELLPRILDNLFATFPQAVRGYILLAEGADAQLVPRAIKHRQSEAGHSMTFGPISRRTALRVMSTGEAILTGDFENTRSDAAQSVLDVPSLSVICAPLMGPSRRPMGIIYLDATDPVSRFTQADLDVLVAVSTIAGQEVERASARQFPTPDGAGALHLGTAKQVQMQFLPQRRPQVGGYEFYDYYQSADEVGGDYFGYIPLADGRLALAIGDVAGKGVSAALLMAHFCAEVRSCLATSPTPAAAVEHLNQDLAAESLNYHFITFSLCVLDTQEHRLTLVNAGHLPPILRRDGIVEQLGVAEAGLPLGCELNASYQQVELEVARGDTLLLCTDGISEAMNAQGNAYGTRRMLEAVARAPEGVEPLGQSLLEDVRRFARGRLQSDDICLICFSRLS